MKKGDLFPLADNYSSDMRFNSMSAKFLGYQEKNSLRAQYTGEFRPPKEDEWYLSGAIVEAYQAKHDMTTPYHIARIVYTETKTVTTVKEVLK